MSTIIFLLLFPLAVAILLLFLKSDAARRIIVIVSALAIAVGSIILVVQNHGEGLKYFDLPGEAISNIMLVIEVALALVIIYLGVKHKKYLASLLALIQAPLLVWYELAEGHNIEVEHNLYIDNLSMVMVLIIGIIGSLICVYAVAYMKDFQTHHSDQEDRRPWFFFLMFLFLSAMFGIVMANNIVWLYFFWEITTLCSFFLIGYTRTPEATRNSFRALIMNLLGGLTFVIAIVIMGKNLNILELSRFLEQGQIAITQGQAAGPAAYITVLVVTLLAFAGLTKAAQMPFSSWLLGAMVAPTPTSALLHSSTMVKAGVFLILKLAPLLGVNGLLDIGPGFMVVMVGGTTFFLGSCAAFSQSNAKKVLAYSTVANLGLICACAGIGTAASVWAAIMLIIFHAVTKSLLFLCVGTAEHNIGSRDIEDMDGLFTRMPHLALFMIVGISGMFLAPFGMLISKWAALQAFIEASNVWIILFVVFGSAVTMFYWGKWLGKMIAIIANREKNEKHVKSEEWGVLGGLTGLVIAVCLTFPLFSDTTILPYLQETFPAMGEEAAVTLAGDNMIIMVVMLALIILLPLLFFGKTKSRIVPLYMGGANEGDNLTFVGSMEQPVNVGLRNWYLESWFGEKRMNRIGNIATCIMFSLTFSFVAAMGLMVYDYIKDFGGMM